MPEIQTYEVQQNLTLVLLGLCVGWLVVLFGTLRFGSRFALGALPLGLLIPAAEFLTSPALASGLLIPEVALLNAAYWLVPGLLCAGVALMLRRKTDPARQRTAARFAIGGAASAMVLMAGWILLMRHLYTVGAGEPLRLVTAFFLVGLLGAFVALCALSAKRLIVR